MTITHNSTMRLTWLLLLTAVLSALGGCASMATSATGRMADNLSVAILDQDDPETVKAGMPSYLLLIDSLIDGDPQNENLLLSGSRLYGAFASAFVKDPERAKRLTIKARDYSDRALCAPFRAMRLAPTADATERPAYKYSSNQLIVSLTQDSKHSGLTTS